MLFSKYYYHVLMPISTIKHAHIDYQAFEKVYSKCLISQKNNDS